MIRLFISISLLIVACRAFSQMNSGTLPNYLDLKMTLLDDSISIKSPSTKNWKNTTFFPNAFFCRLEDRIDAQNKFKSRFRLGTVEVVNSLEGK